MSGSSKIGTLLPMLTMEKIIFLVSGRLRITTRALITLLHFDLKMTLLRNDKPICASAAQYFCEGRSGATDRLKGTSVAGLSLSERG